MPQPDVPRASDRPDSPPNIADVLAAINAVRSGTNERVRAAHFDSQVHVLAGPTFVLDAAAARTTATLRAFLETRDGPKGAYYRARRLLREGHTDDALALLRAAAAQDFVPAA